jgi:hypothetical protein
MNFWHCPIVRALLCVIYLVIMIFGKISFIDEIDLVEILNSEFER